MATNAVNLDALIPRADLELKSDDKENFRRGDTLRITDLTLDAFLYSTLRKPDFQRETANWSPQKIYDFVLTFLDGDLIPAIILWGAGGVNFVIDGAHRLSAILAWVQDDYGDGETSRRFFQNDIPPEQLRAAKRTRDLIEKTIGTYQEHKVAASQPRSKPEVLERAKRLSSLALQLQWVVAGTAKKAEASFFKINQAATPIDPTELRILKARGAPNAITSRAIVRNATGHKYWSTFSQDIQDEIEKISSEVYSNLFKPPLETPVKTLDLPIAGRGYSGQALPLIFDLVNLANNIPVVDATKRKVENILAFEDKTGEETVAFLKNTRRISNRISGVHPSSLGLHPAVYFYSASGRHQPTAFLAVIEFILEMEKKNYLKKFTDVRKVFEDFILQNKSFSNQITVRFGSGPKGYSRLKDLHWEIMKKFLEGCSDRELSEHLHGHQDYRFLTNDDVSTPISARSFSRDTKSATFLREALKNPLRCAICNGLIHFNSIQIDHIVRKEDGGMGVLDNAQLTHPYCNSTIKN